MTEPYPIGSGRPDYRTQHNRDLYPAPSVESLRNLAAMVRFAFDDEWQRKATPPQRVAGRELRDALETVCAGEPVRLAERVLNILYPASLLMLDPQSREHLDLNDVDDAQLRQELTLLKLRLQVQDMWATRLSYGVVDGWLTERLTELSRRVARD